MRLEIRECGPAKNKIVCKKQYSGNCEINAGPGIFYLRKMSTGRDVLLRISTSGRANG